MKRTDGIQTALGGVSVLEAFANARVQTVRVSLKQDAVHKLFHGTRNGARGFRNRPVKDS